MNRRELLKSIALGSTYLSITGFHSIKLPGSIPEEKDGNLYVRRPGCKIPIIYEANVVVIGGSTAGVAAASAAAYEGANVFLVSGDPYLGGDISGTYRFWDITPSKKTEIESKLFCQGLPTPNEFKKALEDVLLDQDIPFLLSSYVSNILIDNSGNPAGVVIANRSGEQIIKAGIIIDATERATCAKLMGISFTKYPAGKHNFNFTVLGNAPKLGYSVEKLHPAYIHKEKSYQALRYSLSIQMQDDSFASFAKAEQKARDITWDVNQVNASDVLFEIPPNHINGIRCYKETEVDFTSINLDCFRPENTKAIYILSGLADINREVAKKLLEPSNMLLMGYRIGKQAARVAKRNTVGKISSQQKKYPSSTIKMVTQHQDEMRPQHQLGFISIKDEYIPVIGKYDLVVVGGGSAGSSAAISAARKNTKVLLMEYLHGLGGVGTMGYIGTYWYGYKNGFVKEVEKGWKMLEGAENHPRSQVRNSQWVLDWKSEWWRREILSAGGDIWFGVLGCGAVVEGNNIRGVVVATPQGKGIVLAEKVIDSTGSGDIAIAAGADYEYTGADSIAIQRAGVCPAQPEDNYNNTSFTYIDDSDVFDVTSAFVSARDKFRLAFDISKLIDTRERRRIKGDYMVSVLDIMNKRTYPDTISMHRSNFDSHSEILVNPLFNIINPFKVIPEGKTILAEVPLRALLPKGLKNILVTGLGMSAHRDAMPVLRMQACLENQGYAVGLLSSEAIRLGKEYREIDLTPIQKELVKLGNLEESVLKQKDNYPPSMEKVLKAIDTIPENFKNIGLVAWKLEEIIPPMREKLKKAEQINDKISYALVLGSYGYDDGWIILRDAIDSFKEWDQGWVGGPDNGFGKIDCPFDLDNLIIALGRCKKTEALPSIHRLAKQLSLLSSFKHYRSIAEACETIGSQSSAPVLHDLLSMPGIRNYTIKDYKERIFSFTTRSEDPINNSNLHKSDLIRLSLREIILARALYKCGDKNKLGETILREFASDIRGHYARHARGILQQD